jgi:hypothetical protein
VVPGSRPVLLGGRLLGLVPRTVLLVVVPRTVFGGALRARTHCALRLLTPRVALMRMPSDILLQRPMKALGPMQRSSANEQHLHTELEQGLV